MLIILIFSFIESVLHLAKCRLDPSLFFLDPVFIIRYILGSIINHELTDEIIVSVSPLLIQTATLDVGTTLSQLKEWHIFIVGLELLDSLSRFLSRRGLLRLQKVGI